MPDREDITRVHPDGTDRLVVTTRRNIYLIDTRAAIDHARATHSIRSTAAWAEAYHEKLVAADWRHGVAWLISRKEWLKAERLLELQLKKGGDADRLSAVLWRAHLLARQSNHGDAIEAYAEAASLASTNAPAELFARMNQTVLLVEAQRFKEAVALADAIQDRFPQIRPERDDEPFAEFIRDARLEASRAAASTPAAPTHGQTPPKAELRPREH